MSKNNLLIIDDDELFSESLSQELNETHLFQATCIQGSSQFSELAQESFDLVLVDLRLRNESGLNLIEEINRIWPKAQIYLMTGFGTIATAVSAIKLGARDYLTKPITIEKVKALLTETEVATDDLGQDSPLSLDRVEREYIEHILAQEKGNISRAANKLGLHRQSLQRKLKKWVPFK